MTKPISPLRQRMIDDMTMRNLSANTQETYIRSVAQFSAFHRRSPDKLGVKHVRRLVGGALSGAVAAEDIRHFELWTRHCRVQSGAAVTREAEEDWAR
jgi:hypothetical protein